MAFFWSLSQTKLGKPFSHRYYTSIDFMPIYNWAKMHETGNMDYLISSKGLYHRLPETQWRRLLNQFYKEVGISERYREYLKKIKRITILTCEAALNKDSAKQTWATIKEGEIKEFTDKTEALDFYLTLAEVSKYYGPINPHKVSVSQYHGIVKSMQEAALDRDWETL